MSDTAPGEGAPAPIPTAWSITEPVYDADALNPTLAISPWQGHRDFAYDLIRFARPALIVELGVHYGCSFFAFCQAVKDHRLEAQVIGVDTWTGDPHAGYYGEEVFELVEKTRASHFADDRFAFRRLTFDEAVAAFADNSIDLLHIDGLHTYEAVSRDFTAWLPKLANDGIMLLHDIAPASGYESARFWAEIAQRHPHFEFLNRWGLGIVFPKGDRWYRAAVDAGVPDKIRGYLYRGEWLAANARAAIDLQWQKEQTDRWWQEGERLKSQIAGLEWRIAQLEEWRSVFSIGNVRIVHRSDRV